MESMDEAVTDAGDDLGLRLEHPADDGGRRAARVDEPQHIPRCQIFEGDACDGGVDQLSGHAPVGEIGDCRQVRDHELVGSGAGVELLDGPAHLRGLRNVRADDLAVILDHREGDERSDGEEQGSGHRRSPGITRKPLRVGDHEGHPDLLLVHRRALAPELVRRAQLAVVRGADDDGVLELADVR